jgi:hypothetical protein
MGKTHFDMKPKTELANHWQALDSGIPMAPYNPVFKDDTLDAVNKFLFSSHLAVDFGSAPGQTTMVIFDPRRNIFSARYGSVKFAAVKWVVQKIRSLFRAKRLPSVNFRILKINRKRKRLIKNLLKGSERSTNHADR